METITLQMVFVKSNGGNRTLRVPSPASDLTAGTIGTAAMRIINGNVFDDDADLTALREANLVRVERSTVI